MLQVQQERILRAVQPPVLLHPDLLARHAEENPAAPRPLRLGRHRRQVGQLSNLHDVVHRVLSMRSLNWDLVPIGIKLLIL